MIIEGIKFGRPTRDAIIHGIWEFDDPDRVRLTYVETRSEENSRVRELREETFGVEDLDAALDQAKFLADAARRLAEEAKPPGDD